VKVSFCFGKHLLVVIRQYSRGILNFPRKIPVFRDFFETSPELK